MAAKKPKKGKKRTPAQMEAMKDWQASGLKAISHLSHAQRSAAARKAAATRKATAQASSGIAGTGQVPHQAPLADGLPVCAAEAVLLSQRAAGCAGGLDPVALWDLAGEVIPEVAAAAGALVERCGLEVGAVLGVRLPDGRRHAVLNVPGGWVSWGMLVAPAGQVEEAWRLTWPVA